MSAISDLDMCNVVEGALHRIQALAQHLIEGDDHRLAEIMAYVERDADESLKTTHQWWEDRKRSDKAAA